MEQPHSTRRDFVQNCLIALLSLSAVLLFALVQTVFPGLESPFPASLFSMQTAAPSQSGDKQNVSLSAPVHIAVTGTFGRYGSRVLSTQDTAFIPLRTILGQAIESAQPFVPCSRGEFQQALSETSLYYDVLSPLPMTVAAELMGVSRYDSLSVRRLVLRAKDHSVFLYLWDDAGTCFSAATSVLPEELTALAETFEQGNAYFAMDAFDPALQWEAVSPYSLFTSLSDAPPQLTGSSAVNQEFLLETLGFNPYTNSRYTESSGAVVITENDRTVRISPDNVLEYHSSGADTVQFPASSTPAQQAGHVQALLTQLLSFSATDASLFLCDMQQTPEESVFRFHYQFQGLPIHLPADAYAAEVTVRGNTVASLTLYLRHYTKTTDTSVLLPLEQALAISAAQPGRELCLGYADRAGGTIHAAWFAQ